MSNERFTQGKGPLDDGYFSETIIDNETGKTYYDGRRPNYIATGELIDVLNKYNTENIELKKFKEQVTNYIDEKIKTVNNSSFNNPTDLQLSIQLHELESLVRGNRNE